MDNTENSVINFSISKYLDLFYKKHKYTKLAMVITPKQVAYLMGNLIDHWPKAVKLSQTLFPQKNYNHNHLYDGEIRIYSVGGDLYDGGIWIYSVGDKLTIELPDFLDLAQYQCLEELLNEVIEYEKEKNVKILDFDVNEMLNKAKSNLCESYDSTEVIITKPVNLSNDPTIREIMAGKPHNLQNLKQVNRSFH